MLKIIVILSIILAVGVGAAFFFGYLNKPAFKPKPPPLSQNLRQQSLPVQTSPSPSPAIKNPMGQDVSIKADTTQEGPWNHDLQVAVSNDGKAFRDSKLFQSKAGVPSVIHDKKGKLYAAFQWFPEDNPQGFDKVAIKTSVDGGNTWTEPVQAVFNNYPANLSRPFDPTLVLNPEGTIRMYYTVNPASGPNAVTSYYSAISDDGINYTFEEKPRFEIDKTMLIDSAGAVYNDTYFLLAPHPQNGAYFATSPDGLNFTRGKDINSASKYNWTGNVLNFNGKIRFYGNSTPGGKVFYSETTDGVTWTEPVLTNVEGAGDPAVVQALESIYLMIYTGGHKK